MKPCSICTSPSRGTIDSLLLEGRTLSVIAKEFHATKSSLSRHRRHMGQVLSSAMERKRQKAEAEGDQLLERFEYLWLKALKILDDAEANNSQAIAVSTIRELRGILNSIGTFSGKLPSQTTNIAVFFQNPKWIETRQNLMRALEPYPEARNAVMAALADQPLALPAPPFRAGAEEEKNDIEILHE